MEKAISLLSNLVLNVPYMKQQSGSWGRIIALATGNPAASASSRSVGRQLTALLQSKGCSLPNGKWANSGGPGSAGEISMSVLQAAHKAGLVTPEEIVQALVSAHESESSVGGGAGVDVSAFLPKSTEVAKKAK